MGSKFGRRSFLAGGAAAAAASVALGAGGDLLSGSGVAGAARTNGPGRNGVSTSKPKRGGSLTFGTDTEESGFLPTTARFDEVGVMYARTVFDPLTAITSRGGWAPYLAQSVSANADYTTWTVTLRPGIKFSDGTDLTGQVLLNNFEAHKASALTGPAIDPILDNFTQTGDLTVQANFNSPWLAFPYYLAGGIGGQIAYPVSQSNLDDPTHASNNPVGTGPFIFEQWIPNSHFTAKRNPNYWRKGLPYLDSITFKPIVDPDARSEALQSGAIDIMVCDTPQVIVQYRGNKKWAYIDDSGAVVGEPDMNCLLVNTGAAPFDNADVRMAVAKAIDSSAYSRVIDLSVNAPSTGPFVQGTPYYTKTGYPSYDLKGASELIKKVKAKTGKPVSIDLGGIPSPYTARAGQYLQQKLQAAGMEVSLKTVQQNDLIDNALIGSYQLYQWRQFGAVNPDLNYIFWSSTTDGAEHSLAINMARNDDPAIQAALITGRQSPSAATRAKAYQTVSKRFAVDLPYIWLDRAVWSIMAQSKVQNFANPTMPSGAKAWPMITGSIWPTQIWLS